MTDNTATTTASISTGGTDVATISTGNIDDREYSDFIARMNRRLNDLIKAGEPLFTTSAELWPFYVESFRDPGERQYHNCSACRDFMKRYGGLATISENGRVAPVFWNRHDTPGGYRDMAFRLFLEVEQAGVSGVFIPPTVELGTAGGNGWRHYSATVPASMVWTGKTKTAGQAMAEKREDFRNVRRALIEFTPKLLAQALTLLDSGVLERPEKVIGPVRWLVELQEARQNAVGRDNVIWRAVATAPSGFCHPRASMAGSLLEDLANGVDLADAQRKFKAKMHPLRYQRPQAAPTEGAIDRAEKIFEQMGIAQSLERRFARVDECELLWSPSQDETPEAGGIFAHLRKGSEPSGVADGGPIAWTRFADQVLPGAVDLRIEVPRRGGFFAFVTAVHEDAPPILQWDNADRRNPVSWYVYHGGSSAESFDLGVGLAKVTGVAVNPGQWFGAMGHIDNNVVLLIEGARDRFNRGGLGLFPEILKSELHGVRSVIEAHSGVTKIQLTDGPNAAGLTAKGATVVVTDKSGVAIRYTIDRWA